MRSSIKSKSVIFIVVMVVLLSLCACGNPIYKDNQVAIKSVLDNQIIKFGLNVRNVLWSGGWTPTSFQINPKKHKIEDITMPDGYAFADEYRSDYEYFIRNQVSGEMFVIIRSDIASNSYALGNMRGYLYYFRGSCEDRIATVFPYYLFIDRPTDGEDYFALIVGEKIAIREDKQSFIDFYTLYGYDVLDEQDCLIIGKDDIKFGISFIDFLDKECVEYTII
ncbi:MAG: hypothetical protein ACI4M5_04645 [Christensenellales bacterium]